jgi:Tfp pilus assembly PilM family ATPase
MKAFSFSRNRSVLVLDPGHRSIKILLATRRKGEVQVTQHRLMDLPEGDRAGPEALSKRVEGLLSEFGSVPVSLSLPQQLSIYQVIDLPQVDLEKIKVLIKQETAKFTGLSEGRIVYDYGKLNPFGKYQNPYWVTFAKEEEVLGEASRLAGVGERVCEIITPANALIATYQSLPSQSDNALLVELGATSTVVALVVQKQPAYAIHYPMGGDAFSEAIASEKSRASQAPQPLKLKENNANEQFGSPGLRSAVDGWRSELEKILRDWLRENPELNLSANSFRVLLSGGGACKPGLLNYLRSTSHLRFTEWPKSPVGQTELPLGRYAIAYGVAIKSIGVSFPSASLFPTDLREARKSRSAQEWLQKVTWTLLIAVALLLLFGTAQKLSLAGKKQALLKKSQTVLRDARDVEALHRQWEESYEQLRPVLKEQRRTMDALATLSQLQRVRGDKKLWYVLFADQKSYFTGQTTPLPEPVTVLNFDTITNPAPAANPTPVGKYGYIAELSLAEEGEAMRQTLSKVVSELKNNPAFTNVDTLSLDQRKFLVNTNVIIPERHFALSIELAEDIFENPLPGKPPKPDKREIKPNPRIARPMPGRTPINSGKIKPE